MRHASSPPALPGQNRLGFVIAFTLATPPVQPPPPHPPLPQTREDMALNMAQGLSKYATQENGMVLRRHLENTTYLSGGHDTAYKSRRGYHRPRP